MLVVNVIVLGVVTVVAVMVVGLVVLAVAQACQCPGQIIIGLIAHLDRSLRRRHFRKTPILGDPRVAQVQRTRASYAN